MIHLLQNEYIIIGIIIVSSLIISFRNNIQNTTILEKIFKHSFFKVLLLSIITYISDINKHIGLTLAIVYLVIDTYINNLPSEETSTYTNPYQFNKTNKNIEKEKTNAINEEPQSINEKPTSKIINQTKEGFNNLLDGDTIGNIINTSRLHCNKYNKSLPSCLSIVEKTQQINDLALDILTTYDKMKNKNKTNIHNNDEAELEQTILEQKPMGGLEGFDNQINTITNKYKELY